MISIASEPHHAANVNAYPSAPTGRWTKLWAISRQRGPERARSFSRPNQEVALSGGTGSEIRTPASDATRLRSNCANALDRTNKIHANGRARTNVMSSPTLVARKATVKPNVTAATGKAVTL